MTGGGAWARAGVPERWETEHTGNYDVWLSCLAGPNGKHRTSTANLYIPGVIGAQ